jgi:hypothetical protein
MGLLFPMFSGIGYSIYQGSTENHFCEWTPWLNIVIIIIIIILLFNEIEGVLKLKSYWIVASVIFSHINRFSAPNFYCPLASWLF